MNIPLLIKGKPVADKIYHSIKEKICTLKNQNKKPPGLAVIIVGSDAASKTYVNMKKNRCAELGITSHGYNFDESEKEETLLELIEQLNNNQDVNGILVQLPLPAHFDTHKILNAIDPNKDVDCFHPINVGKLFLGLPTFRPCTPYGIYELLKFYNIPVKSKHIVIVGRSNIVGKPLASIFVQKKEHANATVTICHSHSSNLEAITASADILISAIGKPNLIKENMVKKNAVVIDVGMNRVPDSNSATGYRLVGDVDYEKVYPKTYAITPVPGGVGLTTIAMLMKNTFKAYSLQNENLK